MNNHAIKILLLGLITVFLSGCLLDYDAEKEANLTPKQRCDGMKRQMMYNYYNPNSQAKFLTDSQNEALAEEYRLNCTEITGHVPFTKA